MSCSSVSCPSLQVRKFVNIKRADFDRFFGQTIRYLLVCIFDMTCRTVVELKTEINGAGREIDKSECDIGLRRDFIVPRSRVSRTGIQVNYFLTSY